MIELSDSRCLRLRTKLDLLKGDLAVLHKAEWEESKHPRGEHGRFSSGGGGGDEEESSRTDFFRPTNSEAHDYATTTLRWLKTATTVGMVVGTTIAAGAAISAMVGTLPVSGPTAAVLTGASMFVARTATGKMAALEIIDYMLGNLLYYREEQIRHKEHRVSKAAPKVDPILLVLRTLLDAVKQEKKKHALVEASTAS